MIVEGIKVDVASKPSVMPNTESTLSLADSRVFRQNVKISARALDGVVSTGKPADRLFVLALAMGLGVGVG